MKNNERKISSRIYKRIDNIVISKDKHYEYIRLVDEIITNKEYYYLISTLELYYGIIIAEKPLEYVKHEVFYEILKHAFDPFSKKLNKIYRSKKVYQMGFDIYDDLSGDRIGEIQELDINELSAGKYYESEKIRDILNPKYTYLAYKKSNDTDWTVITDIGDDKPETELLKMYKIAIDYIK